MKTTIKGLATSITHVFLPQFNKNGLKYKYLIMTNNLPEPILVSIYIKTYVNLYHIRLTLNGNICIDIYR